MISSAQIRPAVVPAFAFAWVELIFHRLYMPKLLLYKGQKVYSLRIHIWKSSSSSSSSFIIIMIIKFTRSQGWPMFKRLLVELLRFLEPYLRIPELTEPIRLLYKGTLKALLVLPRPIRNLPRVPSAELVAQVLLHDFPEFLCDYHYSFCDVIPPTCIQLRNIILSAFPRSMHLPDPFTPNLKVLSPYSSARTV